MRRFSPLLWSTTALTAMFVVASPASAQDQPVPPDPTATAQENPATPAQNADAPTGPAEAAGTDDNSIVVTGLRRSLQSARNIKRNSDQVVDAIVAEDIGKLPDITVSDTAARIPGVMVERSRGEAGRVLVRGLDNTYYTTTYNGREIFTAETRSVALQDFPSGAIAALEAFKTSTANLVEPGLAGLVNVRSRRPFDFKGFEVAGSAWLLYPNQSRNLTPNANLLVTNRWNAGEGEIGALINFSYTKLDYKDSMRRHGFFIADLAGGRSPDWPEIHYDTGSRWRPSVNGALQWRPEPGLELYLEGLWQGYRDNVSDRMWAQPLWGGGSYDNLVFDGDSNRILSGTVNTPTGCCGAGTTWGFQGATKRRTNTYQFALGGSYDAGPLKITADLARTDSTFKLRTESIDYEINTNDYSVNWYTGRPGGYGPTFQVVGLDPTDPSIYRYRGFFEDYATAKGDDWQARLDAEYAPNLEFIPKIQAGLRYVDRDASNVGGNRYWQHAGSNISISNVPLDYELFSSAFHGDNHKPFPLTWLVPTFGSVWNNLTELRQFNVNLGPTQYGSNDINDPATDPGRTFNINERSYAAYGQVNFKFDSGPTQIDGILGLRAVRTKDDIHGFATSAGVATPVDFKNSYTDWLPNANLNIGFASNWKLRLAATKTRTRPTFQQLNPALNLAPPNTSCDPTQTDCVRTGGGGNPFLEPLRSNNYDASLEYYFSRTGFASVSAFRRDMKGFIRNRTFQYPDLDPDTGFPLLITGPVNTRSARIEGLEAQVRTFLDFGSLPQWLHSFGIEANATYLDAKADFELFCAPDAPSCDAPIGGGNATVQRLRIPDVSKWGANLTAMYENGPLSARLSYNWRGHYPEGGLDERGDYTLQGRGRPAPRLDLSTSYTVNDNFTVFFDWTNILNKPFKSDIVRVNYSNGSPTATEVFPMIVRYEERILSGGIRFRWSGGERAAAPPPPPMVMPPPPPPPPAPVMEQPAPPPPSPAPVERGERG
jgi:TonB-dependent receptor